LTIIPALIVIALRLDALKILLLSQVVLSFAIPFALIPLVLLTRSKAVMSDLVNSPRTNYMAYLVTAINRRPESAAALQDGGRPVLARDCGTLAGANESNKKVNS